MRYILAVLLVILFIFGSFKIELTKPPSAGVPISPPFLAQKTPWADSIFAKMTLEEKIGQLFNVAAYSNKGEKHLKEIEELIQKYKIGGLTFFKGGPVKQAKMTNHYQSLSALPLMIAIDGEWGLAMRLDSTLKYPWQMTLGAVKDPELIYQMGMDMARQFHRLGVHVNFAPVVDVNNNPENPVIFARSFGEDRENVAEKGIAYMQGLQAGNILACAKHFPGHGDTDTDSHISLPVVNHSPARLDSIELYPFKKLIEAGVGSIMSAHLYLPQLTPGQKVASSLNAKIIDTLLKQKMGFQGLVFTDGLNMGGVAKYQESAEIDLQALMAGNDVLLLSQDVPAAIQRIKAAIDEGTLSVERIEKSALKVLKAKEWLGLAKYKPVQVEGLTTDLNQKKDRFLIRQLVENSLTLLRNQDELIPIRELKDQRIISLALTEEGVSYRSFQQSLNLYAQVDTLAYKSLSVSQQKKLMDTLLDYDKIIVSVHKSNKNPWVKAEINTEFKNFINILRLRKSTALVLFANAYNLNDFLAARHVDALLLAYQNSRDAQELSAQLLFGAIAAKGRLPLRLSEKMPFGQGQTNSKLNRLKYTLPEEVGLKSEDLALVDSIVMEGIYEKAYPGAQVLVAKSGKVVYHKAFGSHTYENKREVKKNDLYDLASVTKITSTLLAIMRLDGEGEISLDDKLGKYLKMVRGTDYEQLILRDILAHQAGLASWIPFYNKTLHHGMPRYDLYSEDSSKTYSVRVAEDLFMKKAYVDTIFYRILFRAKIDPDKGYKYSDVGYYLLKEMVEEMTGENISDYNQAVFYQSLGMNYTGFLPREKFPLSQIIPTEKDNIFRKQLIHGDVHDPGAAMLGGIGGHAGLFSNANDLAKLMQMYLQNGVYGGQPYLREEVIEEYTKCQFCVDSIPTNKEENRRGAGFDKPQLHGEPGPTCECISFKSYGHSGFTGTYTWVDPEEELVYIFLSNRIYPDAKNSKLVKLNIRTRIQEQIYTSIHNMKFRNSQTSHNLNKP